MASPNRRNQIENAVNDDVDEDYEDDLFPKSEYYIRASHIVKQGQLLNNENIIDVGTVFASLGSESGCVRSIVDL